MSNAGNRIKCTMDRPSPELVKRAGLVPTPNLGDSMNRVRCLSSALRPYGRPGLRAVGPAFTVKCRIADNLMLHKAIDLAQPGDVIVVDAGGESPHAVTGELMVAHMFLRGIAGLIIDGPIRDPQGIAEVGLPVWARGVTPAGPYKDGPGEIGFPISCTGVAVNPGDLVVADDSGVAIIPLAEAEAIVTAGEAVLRRETAVMEQIRAGKWDRAWVDATLKAKGCEYVD